MYTRKDEFTAVKKQRCTQERCTFSKCFSCLWTKKRGNKRTEKRTVQFFQCSKEDANDL